MNSVLGMLLVLFGFALWVLAGILPVLRLLRENGRVNASLDTTWMGVFTLSRHPIPDVRGARLVADPGNLARKRPELNIADEWHPLNVMPAPSQATWARLTPIIDHFARHDGPPKLVLPLRDRMSTMLGFALLFSLGTVSAFSGLLIILRGG